MNRNDTLLSVQSARLDRLERTVLLCLYVFFLFRMGIDYVETKSYVTLIYIIDQSVVLVFLLVRRPSVSISPRVLDWFYGLAGTGITFLLGPPSDTPLIPVALAALLMIIGFCIHFSAKLRLARSFGVIAANRGVVVAGIYRWVRHPMYLGYVITHVAVLLSGPTFANIIIMFLAWVLFVKRIRSEERELSNDENYRNYCARVRWRMFPWIW